MRRVRARARAAPTPGGRRPRGEAAARAAATPRRRRRRRLSRRRRTRASALRVVRGDRARCRVRAVDRPRAPRDRRPDARALVRGHPRFVTVYFSSAAGRRAARRASAPEGRKEAAARAAGVPASRAARVRGVHRLFSKNGGCARGSAASDSGTPRLRERRRRRRIRAKDDAVVRDARGGRVASIGGDVSECVSTTRRESRRRLCLVVVSAGPKEVRDVFIRARRARGDAMRARLLLVVRRELVRAKAGVPVVSRARRAAVARSRRGVLRREAREARGLRRERTVVYRCSRS